jgi:phage baseplate assembly protein W
MLTDNTINYLDITRDKGIGLDLPIFSDYGSGMQINYTTLDQAAANAKNLLLTNHGERVMLPTFGCNLYKSLHENLTEFLVENTKAMIQSQFKYWLSYIFINRLDVYADSDYNKLYISIEISLKNNQFDTRSIELEVRRTNQ